MAEGIGWWNREQQIDKNLGRDERAEAAVDASMIFPRLHPWFLLYTA
jgi:hypothetical protein